MKLLIAFLILLVVVVLIQVSRNHCSWQGTEYAVDWAACVTRG